MAGVARLDLNESPFAPPREVTRRVEEELARINRYPERGLIDKAYEALSTYTGVEKDYITITCGGDSALYMLFTMLASQGDRVAIPRYSFSTIKKLARSLSLRVSEVPLWEDGEWWSIDREALFEAAREASVTVIDNPNNPTGSMLLQKRAVEELAQESRGFLVIDEAYYEFSRETVAGMVPESSNLVVVRTLSKAFSLAGLRVGYVVAPKEIAERIRYLNPYSTSRLSLAAIIAYMSPENLKHVRTVVEYVDRWKEKLRRETYKMGVKTYKSKANFILMDTGIEEAGEKLENLGVKVRRVEISDTMVRASIGMEWENEKLLEALQELKTR